MVLNRIIIFAYDVEKLKGFYVTHFNLSVTTEIEHEWVVLTAGPIEIALHRIGEAYRTENTGGFKAANNTKLVFSVTGNLHAIRESLAQKGVLMRDIKTFDGLNALFCDGEDPEGNVFQLEQRLD